MHERRISTHTMLYHNINYNMLTEIRHNNDTHKIWKDTFHLSLADVMTAGWKPGSPGHAVRRKRGRDLFWFCSKRDGKINDPAEWHTCTPPSLCSYTCTHALAHAYTHAHAIRQPYSVHTWTNMRNAKNMSPITVIKMVNSFHGTPWIYRCLSFIWGLACLCCCRCLLFFLLHAFFPISLPTDLWISRSHFFLFGIFTPLHVCSTPSCVCAWCVFFLSRAKTSPTHHFIHSLLVLSFTLIIMGDFFGRAWRSRICENNNKSKMMHIVRGWGRFLCPSHR